MQQVNDAPTASASITPGPTPVSLCVAVQRERTSITRGQSALWTVSAWTQGGNVPDATVRLTASPTSVTPEFSFGCGSYDGTPSCDLGAVDANSTRRQLQARVAVAATASTVTSVQLTATAGTTYLPKDKDPTASATVAVTAAPAPTSTPTAPATSAAPVTSTSPVSVGNLPYLPSVTASPALSPGGNAAALFPTLSPAASAPASGNPAKANTRTVASTSALPLGAPVVGAQLIGLGVLALAFVLMVTRLSIRRRSAATPATGSQPEGLDKSTPEN